MRTEATKEFARSYKALFAYFYGIAPKRTEIKSAPIEDDTGFTTFIPTPVTVIDTDRGITTPIPVMPMTQEEFEDRGNRFIVELNENVLNYSNEINRAFLLSCFGEVGFGDKILPTIKMLMDAELYDEAILLDKLIRYNDFIYSLQKDTDIWSEFDGIEQYKKEIKNNSKTIKEEIQRDYIPKNIQDSSIPINPQHLTTRIKKKGRPSKPFDDILVSDREIIKGKLHSLIDGKGDKQAVLYIKAAIQMGMIQKPTYTQFINEFGNIVSKQNFNSCLSRNTYSDDELRGAKQALESK